MRVSQLGGGQIVSELCPQEIVERLQPSRCQTHRTIRYTLIECTCQIWAEWKGIAFSRAKIFSPFDLPLHLPTLLFEETTSSIHITKQSVKPTLDQNSRWINEQFTSFQNPKNSNPCDNNNLFSRREGEKRKRRRIRTKKQFAYNGWKTGNNRLGIFVPRRLSAGMEWGKGGYWCSSDKICRFSIRASITCTPNSGTCWWLRSRERGLDRV